MTRGLQNETRDLKNCHIGKIMEFHVCSELDDHRYIYKKNDDQRYGQFLGITDSLSQNGSK